MRYMGDLDTSQPTRSDSEILDSVWKIISACCEHPSLADEIYCQNVKQLTNNRSTRSYAHITSHLVCNNNPEWAAGLKEEEEKIY